MANALKGQKKIVLYSTLLPLQGVIPRATIPRALPWAKSPSGLAFQAVSPDINLSSIKKLEIFEFLDVEKEMRGNKTKNVVFVVQVVFKKIGSFVFLDVDLERC